LCNKIFSTSPQVPFAVGHRKENWPGFFELVLASRSLTSAVPDAGNDKLYSKFQFQEKRFGVFAHIKLKCLTLSSDKKALSAQSSKGDSR
jgi:hypothetical protein